MCTANSGGMEGVGREVEPLISGIDAIDGHAQIQIGKWGNGHPVELLPLNRWPRQHRRRRKSSRWIMPAFIRALD